MVLYVMAFSELLLLCLALLQLVQGVLKQSGFLTVTIVKKCLNLYPNYDWNLIRRLDIFHWKQCFLTQSQKVLKIARLARIYQLGDCFDVNKTSIFTKYTSTLYEIYNQIIRISSLLMRHQPYFRYIFKYFFLIEKFQKSHFGLGDPVGSLVSTCTLGADDRTQLFYNKKQLIFPSDFYCPPFYWVVLFLLRSRWFQFLNYFQPSLGVEG